MLICHSVRTTLNIEDELYRRIKALAALRGESVTAIVEESLRLTLLTAQASDAVVHMPVSQRRHRYASQFVAARVDPPHPSAVRDYLDRTEG